MYICLDQYLLMNRKLFITYMFNWYQTGRNNWIDACGSWTVIWYIISCSWVDNITVMIWYIVNCNYVEINAVMIWCIVSCNWVDTGGRRTVIIWYIVSCNWVDNSTVIWYNMYTRIELSAVQLWLIL